MNWTLVFSTFSLFVYLFIAWQFGGIAAGFSAVLFCLGGATFAQIAEQFYSKSDELWRVVEKNSWTVANDTDGWMVLCCNQPLSMAIESPKDAVLHALKNCEEPT